MQQQTPNDEEIWKLVPGWEDRYEVSNTGFVRNVNTKQLRKFQIVNGYARISFSRYVSITEGKVKNKTQMCFVHRLVANLFLSKLESEKKFVNHKDGNKLNNDISNLEWVTGSQNTVHAFSSKLINPSKGEGHYNSKLKETDILEIKNLLKRGVTQAEISRKFDISTGHVWGIKAGRYWKHVGEINE